MHLGIPEFIEQIFCQMTESHEFCGIQETGPALDRVEPPEDIVQQTAILWIFFQIDKFVIDIGKQIARFLQEILQKVFHPGKVTHVESPRIPSYRADRQPAADLPRHRSAHRH